MQFSQRRNLWGLVDLANFQQLRVWDVDHELVHCILKEPEQFQVYVLKSTKDASLKLVLKQM